MSKNANPYTTGTMNHKVVTVLLRAKGPLDVREIAKRAKLTLGRTAQVLAALRNPFHNSAGRKAGVSIESEDQGFVVRKVAPDADAKRPSRAQRE